MAYLSPLIGGLEQAPAQFPASTWGAALCRTLSVVSSMAMSEWDSMVAIHDLFVPDWTKTPKGSIVSVVVDCTIHTESMVLGVTVPDAQKVRLYGEINNQVRGCRRLSVLDAVLDFSPGALDLLITDASTVVAHGLSPARDMLRVVELCAGVSCSSVGLCAAGFEHIGSVEWRTPLAHLHATCHPDIPVITGDITQPSCMRDLLQQFKPLSASCQDLLSALQLRWISVRVRRCQVQHVTSHGQSLLPVSKPFVDHRMCHPGQVKSFREVHFASLGIATWIPPF